MSQTLLQENSRQFQQHATLRNKLSRTINYQRDIKHFRTIPKQYLPQSFPDIPVTHSTLTTTFLNKYQDLFLQHLDDVISYNSINLELEEARLRDIVLTTEKHLAQLAAPIQTIRELHQKFLEENNIPVHQINPELQQTLNKRQTTLPSTASSSRLPPLLPSSLNSPNEIEATSPTMSASPTSTPAIISQKRKRQRCSHHRAKKQKMKNFPPKQPHPLPPTAQTSPFLDQRYNKNHPT